MRPPQTQNLSLADVVEKDGTLIVTQSVGPALSNLRNGTFGLLASIPGAVLSYWFFIRAGGSGGADSLGGRATGPMGLFFLLGIPFAFLVMVLQSANRLFGRETFVFDRNEGVFIRNGYTVGPLRDIRAVTAQVRGNGQYPMFQLILELPRCEEVTLVRTHDIPANGEFRLGASFFTNPDKTFSICNPWLDYDEQNLVPFLPPEIVELRRKITEFIGETARKENKV